MKITRIHPMTGEENTFDLKITQQEYDRWESGELIQNVAPQLSADEREFIISGIPIGDFDDLIGADDDFDDDY